MFKCNFALFSIWQASTRQTAVYWQLVDLGPLKVSNCLYCISILNVRVDSRHGFMWFQYLVKWVQKADGLVHDLRIETDLLTIVIVSGCGALYPLNASGLRSQPPKCHQTGPGKRFDFTQLLCLCLDRNAAPLLFKKQLVLWLANRHLGICQEMKFIIICGKLVYWWSICNTESSPYNTAVNWLVVSYNL